MTSKFEENLKNLIILLEEYQDINKYLMEYISLNVKEWENFLKPLCKINKVSYYKKIKEILEKSGFTDLKEDKIRTYIRRAK